MGVPQELYPLHQEEEALHTGYLHAAQQVKQALLSLALVLVWHHQLRSDIIFQLKQFFKALLRQLLSKVTQFLLEQAESGSMPGGLEVEMELQVEEEEDLFQDQCL
jgi:hypothetical protein